MPVFQACKMGCPAAMHVLGGMHTAKREGLTILGDQVLWPIIGLTGHLETPAHGEQAGDRTGAAGGNGRAVGNGDIRAWTSPRQIGACRTLPWKCHWNLAGRARPTRRLQV